MHIDQGDWGERENRKTTTTKDEGDDEPKKKMMKKTLGEKQHIKKVVRLEFENDLIFNLK